MEENTEKDTEDDTIEDSNENQSSNNDDLNQSKKNSENNNPEEENKISERLEAKLSEAYGKQDELQNKYLRIHADLENLKKRSIKEREDAVQRTRSQLISDLLPTIDAFKMGLTEAAKHTEAKGFVEGFQMAMKQLNTVLDDYGLVVLEPENEIFDPKFHEAINYEINNDLEDGTVINTIRCGYRLGDKLLRPASVILSKSENKEE